MGQLTFVLCMLPILPVLSPLNVSISPPTCDNKKVTPDICQMSPKGRITRIENHWPKCCLHTSGDRDLTTPISQAFPTWSCCWRVQHFTTGDHLSPSSFFPWGGSNCVQSPFPMMLLQRSNIVPCSVPTALSTCCQIFSLPKLSIPSLQLS